MWRPISGSESHACWLYSVYDYHMSGRLLGIQVGETPADMNYWFAEAPSSQCSNFLEILKIGTATMTGRLDLNASEPTTALETCAMVENFEKGTLKGLYGIFIKGLLSFVLGVLNAAHTSLAVY